MKVLFSSDYNGWTFADPYLFMYALRTTYGVKHSKLQSI